MTSPPCSSNKQNIQTIDHVQVAIPKGAEDQSREYYCDYLGLEEIQKPTELRRRGGLWLRTGDRELHLGVLDPCQPSTKAHPGFKVSDVVSLAEQLGTLGFEVNWDTNIPGIKRFGTFDIFGNRLEFLEYE